MKPISCFTAVMLAVLFVVSIDASARQFKRAKYLAAGERPYRAATAQLTNSGNTDLIVANYLTSEIVVFLGNGDGTFKKPKSLAVSTPIAVAMGDLNNDGRPDLVVVESGGTGNGSLAIFLGLGDGTFKSSATYTVGAEAGFITIADFDGDGKLDVAETDAGSGSDGTLRVFRGTGKGTLLKPTVYKIPGTPGALTAGDLNGDGHSDLSVTQFSTGSIAVLLNDGTGHFKKPVSYDAGGGEVVDAKIADLRHNGKQDLVVANADVGMVVLLNKGDGTFEPHKIYPPCAKSCQTVEAVTIADFNLDGILDVAAAGHIGNGSLYYGKGDGTFKSAVPIHNSVGNFQDSGLSIAAGDFNNDGAPDLAIPIENDGKVAIMLNTQ